MPSPSPQPTPEIFERAALLQQQALPLLQEAGEWQAIEGYPGRVRSFVHGNLFMLHRTPFQPIPVSQAAEDAGIAPQTQRDVARAYGLDIWWEERKVLSLIWNAGGPLGLIVFKRGAWENALDGCLKLHNMSAWER